MSKIIKTKFTKESTTADVLEQKLDEAIPEKVKSQAELYDEEIEALKKELEAVTDTEALKKKRDEINEEINEYEKELRDKVYELPGETVFRGTAYKRGKVYEFIADIMGHTPVPWQGVLSTFEFIEYWKNASKENQKGIPYMYYNATLRYLGEVQYQGYEMMKKILVVNSLLGAMHDEYTLDLSKYYYVHSKFDVYDQRIQAIEAINEPLNKE